MKPEPENGSTEDSHDENPHYGPLPPPPRMYVPGNSPDDVFDLALNGNSLLASSTLRHVGRVSKRAALATKKQIWDSNDASIVAAQSAVDQWEQGYNALRGLLMAMGHSAQGLYGAAKAGVYGLEHGFLLPVRDWVLLPAFGGVELVARETSSFLQSEHAERMAHQSLDLVRQVPFVGDNLLAPALCIGADVVKRTWEIAQYPIPSPSQVRDSVEYVMTGTKWVLTTAGREIFLYVKRADANITRTLSHTRWKVLGSGPYATLDKLNKREVIDHLCERYFSLVDAVARYELAAHIRVHNRPLYHDLVLTGLLRQRGGDLTSDDEWLSTCPSYRSLECPFFLHEESLSSDSAFARWFRLPNENGKRPTKDTPWICFSKSERIKLERHYRSVLRKYEQNKDSLPTAKAWDIEKDGDTSQRYATNAKWYRPDLENDLLLDQKRHAVSFFPCCPKCRRRHDVIQPPRQPKQFGELCDSCSERTLDAPWVDTLLSPPPLIAVYRPTMWRFYGPGDELRRTAWFLDTQRRGLQPYGEDAQAVLEDAYLFLKWMTRRRVWDGSILLTVEVPSPDGSEKQLVQFSSLYSATAIGKGLGSAISLFKRRVYRGSYFQRSSFSDNLDSATDEKETNHHAASFADGDHDGHSPTQDKNSDANTFEFNNDVIADSRDPPQTNEGWVDINPEDQTGRDMSKQEIDAVPGPNREDVEAVDLESANSDARPKNEAFLFSELLEEPLPLAVPCAEPAVDADNDEESDSIDHLVLIIHGIGEMMQTIDFFGLKKIPTIVDCCAAMRKNHNEVLGVRFNQLYETLDGIAQPRKGRVEYLPVEWHEAFTIQSQRKHHSSSQRSTDYSINDVSLRTIPQLRQFANDTLMDVLYFMSPEHHDMIIDIVVNEMNFVVEKFRELTNFSGEISVVGHSLGSIITWDILDNQSNHATQNEGQGIPEVPQPPPDCNKCNNDTLLSGEEHHEHQSISRDKECSLQSSPTYPHLSFDIDNAFMLGSPIAVFLMIRNQQKPLSTDFTLNGCSRVFNIFHPYDPVAYRIEPLLDPRNAEIEPKIMPHWHGGFRFQYQTKRIWRMFVQQTLRTQETVAETLESGIAALGLLDGAAQGLEDDEGSQSDSTSPLPNHEGRYPLRIVTGNLNQGQRIDYKLQEREIENANEYVAALAAHSCYWLEKDLGLFIARQICLRALERETGEGTPSVNHNSFF